MPRGKKGTYALAEDGAGGLAPVRVDGSSGGVQDVPGVPDSSTWNIAACHAIDELDSRIDGWVRHIPSGDGKQCYWKFKFTRGPWKLHYVMYVADAGNWRSAACGLALKLRDVDAGILRPAMDTFYDPR